MSTECLKERWCSRQLHHDGPCGRAAEADWAIIRALRVDLEAVTQDRDGWKQNALNASDIARGLRAELARVTRDRDDLQVQVRAQAEVIEELQKGKR